MFKHLLIATDGEDGLDRLGHCLESLQATGVECVTFVHSIEYNEDIVGTPSRIAIEVEEAEQQLSSRLDPAPEGLSMDVFVQCGKPAKIILNAIQLNKPDVLILGMAIRNLLLEKMFGSTTMELLPRLSIPMLVMRPQLVSSFTLAELQLRCRHLFDCILIPYDFSESAQMLVDSVITLANTYAEGKKPSLLLLYVVDPSTRRNQSLDSQALRQKAEQDLQDVQHKLIEANPHLSVMTEVRVGTPVREILMATGDSDMTAIAAASRNAGSFWEWSIPSLTGELLRKSWHPVLFFPLLGSN